MFRKVVIGMSGGVDSAVSALLLKERGFQLLGVFMKNWDEFDEKGRCTGEQDLKDAEYACQHLNIELKQVNYVKQYWNSVFTAFLEDYQNGFTPNPDILCNRHIKFDLFHDYVINELKYDAIATGHYAKSSFGTYLQDYKEHGQVELLMPRDSFKDQTFFLSAVKRASLLRTMFPLDSYLKSEVKQIAIKAGLKKLATKRESTGICFVGRRDFKDFIREYIHSKPGDFVDIDTARIVGQHEGIHHWTVGQRCRLHSFLQPYYVACKDAQNNIIYVAAGHNNPALMKNIIYANQVNWLCANPFENAAANSNLHCRFRFQHTKPLVNCCISLDKSNANKLIITLQEPLRAITPGQYAVFYGESACLGSARILSSELQAQHNNNNKANLSNKQMHSLANSCSKSEVDIKQSL